MSRLEPAALELAGEPAPLDSTPEFSRA